MMLNLELAHGELESAKRELASKTHYLRSTSWLFLSRKLRLKNSCEEKQEVARTCKKNVEHLSQRLEDLQRLSQAG